MVNSLILFLIALVLLVHIADARRPKNSGKKAVEDDFEIEDAGEVKEDKAPKKRKSGGRKALKIGDYLKLATKTSDTEQMNRLLSKDMDRMDFLESHHLHSDLSVKNFQGEALLYVTPWNKKGYTFAKNMVHKLDWLVPVW